jgi:predicted Zn-dependent protease
MLTRERAEQLMKQVLSHSKADEAEVVVSDETVTHLRFARNSPSTSGTSSGPAVTVRSSFGVKSGAVTVNQLDEATLRQAVARSEEMARLAPDDPEFMPGLGAQEYAEVPAYFETTATGGARRMAEGVGATIEAARGRDFVAAGFARAAGEVEARGNSRGLFGYHRSSAASFSTTVRTPDGTGSGYAGRVARRIEDIDYAAAARIAVDKASAAQKPRALKPGKYVTILEPSCVANLLQGMVFGMDRRRADEGRSFFAAPRRASGTRQGERLFGAEIDVRSDPKDERCPARPWGDDGVPQAPTSRRPRRCRGRPTCSWLAARGPWPTSSAPRAAACW